MQNVKFSLVDEYLDSKFYKLLKDERFDKKPKKAKYPKPKREK